MKSRYLTLAALLVLCVGLYAFIGHQTPPENTHSTIQAEELPSSAALDAFRSIHTGEDSFDNTVIINSSLVVPKATDVSWEYR